MTARTRAIICVQFPITKRAGSTNLQKNMRKQLSMVLCLLMILMGKHFAKSSFDTCITNCVQCKQMYGHRFAGKMCGDTCIASNGEFLLDCNNPGMIHDYLKRLYKK